MYKNKKLYFWTTEARMSYPSSEDEFLKFIQDTFEFLGYEGEKLIKRNTGFDLIYPDYELVLICICDDEHWGKHEKDRVIEKEELVDICRNAEAYKNRRIILWSTELSGKAIEYAESQNIKTQGIIDIVKEKNILESELNDENADVLNTPNSK